MYIKYNYDNMCVCTCLYILYVSILHRIPSPVKKYCSIAFFIYFFHFMSLYDITCH